MSRSRRSGAAARLVVLLAAACAADRPANTRFDDSAGHVVVEVAGDGFVRSGGRRLPLEALVLELRTATREMDPDQLTRFVVRLRVAPDVRDGRAAAVAQDGMNRLVDQLMIMGVRQVEYL